MDHNAAPGEWYWDRRTGKAYYARRVDDETVEFVSVWHHEEVADAMANDAFVPLDDIGFGGEESVLTMIDSFRLPDEERLSVDES